MDDLSSPQASSLPGSFRRSLYGRGEKPEVKPRRPPGTEDLGAPQAQTELNRLKLAELERAIAEVARKLEDWTDVTRSGMENLRAEMGCIKLEYRFTQTLRSTNSRDDPTPCVQAASPGAFSSRPLLEEGGPDALISDGASHPELVSCKRLDAVEAACHDLRLNIQEVVSVPEATERLLKAELKQVVGQLRDELQLERTKAEQNAVDLLRVEAAGIDLARRVEEVERSVRDIRQDHLSETVAAELMSEVGLLRDKLQMECDTAQQNALGIRRVEAAEEELTRRLEESGRQVWELRQVQQAQNVETTTVRGRLEVAARECSEQAAHTDAVRALLQDEKDRRMSEASGLLARVEAIEQAVEIASEVKAAALLSRLQKMDNPSQDVQPVEEAKTVSQDIECRCKALEAQSADLSGRVLEVGNGLSSQLRVVSDLRASVQAEMAKLTTRLDATEQYGGDLRTHLQAEMARLTTRLDVAEQHIAASPQADVTEVKGLWERIDALESCQRAAVVLHEDTSGASPTAVAVTPSGFDELRRALAATSGDVACLARDLAAVREEHDAAITGIGGLTEFVARSAATCIQRTEERLAEEFAAKRKEFEKAANAQQEALSLKAQAVLAKAGATVGRGRQQQLNTQKALDAAGLGSGAGKDDAESQLDDMSRLDAVAMQLRAEAAAQAAASEARIAAAEAVFSADMKRVRGMLSACVGHWEGTQMDMQEIKPRLLALEAAAAETVTAGRDRRPSVPPQHATAQEALPAHGGEVDRRPAAPVPRLTAGRAEAATWAALNHLPATWPVGAADAADHALGTATRSCPEQSASPPCGSNISGTRSCQEPQCYPLRGSLKGGARQAQSGQTWLDTFQRALRNPAQSVLLGTDLTQCQPQSMPIQEGLKEKLEGIVTSVHHVLGALDLSQQPLPQSIDALGASGHLQPPASAAKSPMAPQSHQQSLVQFSTQSVVLGARATVSTAGGDGSPPQHSPFQCVEDSSPQPTPASALSAPSRDQSPIRINLREQPAWRAGASAGPLTRPPPPTQHQTMNRVKSTDAWDSQSGSSHTTTKGQGNGTPAAWPAAATVPDNATCPPDSALSHSGSRTRSQEVPARLQPSRIGGLSLNSTQPIRRGLLLTSRLPAQPAPNAVGTGQLMAGLASAGSATFAGADSGLRDQGLQGVQVGSSPSNAGSSASAPTSSTLLKPTVPCGICGTGTSHTSAPGSSGASIPTHVRL